MFGAPPGQDAKRLQAAAVVQELAARPQDPAGRRDLLVELVRLTFEIDLAATVASSEFRSYLALRAAVAGVESDELRGRIVAALAVGDRRAVARGAAILARAAELFGLRLVAPLTAPEGFEVVARALTATYVGFVIALQTDPGLLAATREVAAYGSSRAAAWSVPAYVLAGLVLQHLEPDPDARVLPAGELLAGLATIVESGATAAAAVPAGAPSGS